MIYIENSSTDPYFNLAAEEFIFYHFSEPVLRIWQNEPCVVIGKNQLLAAEIDTDFAERNNIQIVRRFSGGGAVFHDLGNINISFINSDGNKNFDSYNEQIISFLKSENLHPATDKRHAIYLDNRKISGCAQYVRGQKSIYHATFLFSCNLNLLENVLKGNSPTEENYKYVKSVKSAVTNISNYLPPLSVNDFKEKLIRFFCNPETEKIILDNKMLEEINFLKLNKYKNDDWIFQGKI